MNILGDENRTKKVNKLDWSARTKTSQRSLFNLYCKLIAFRKSSSAIRSDNISFFHHDSDHHILAYHRWSTEPNNSVVVLFNFSTDDQQSYRIMNWPKNGRWQELMNEIDIQIDENEFQIDLKSYESKIFVLKI
jgi:1,4-alpha-glucan branching enzyme